MRKARVTIECDENILGSLIIDLTEKKSTKIISVQAVAVVPSSVNGRASIEPGMTSYEIFRKLGSTHKKNGFSAADARVAFVASGLSIKSVPNAITTAKKNGTLKVLGQAGRLGALYRFMELR